jgi:hypothetical protein
LTINLYANDIDGDNLNFTAESANEDVVVSVENNLLTLTPSDNWNGSTIISVSVSDGEYNVSDFFGFEVIALNDLPIAVNDYSIVNEDGIVNGNIMINDSDLDANYNDPSDFSSLSVSLLDSTENGISNLSSDGYWI